MRLLFSVFGGGGLVAKSCSTLATPMTVACQAPLSMGFSRQEYWSGLPFPSPGNLSNPGIKPGSPPLQADSSLSESPGKPQFNKKNRKNFEQNKQVLGLFNNPINQKGKSHEYIGEVLNFLLV